MGSGRGVLRVEGGIPASNDVLPLPADGSRPVAWQVDETDAVDDGEVGVATPELSHELNHDADLRLFPLHSPACAQEKARRSTSSPGCRKLCQSPS